MGLLRTFAPLAFMATSALAAPATSQSLSNSGPGKMIYAPLRKDLFSASTALQALVQTQSNGTADFDLKDLTYTVGTYMIDVQVGTPAQSIALQVDTGSAGSWVFSPDACKKVGAEKLIKECGGAFRIKQSKTAFETNTDYGVFFNAYSDKSHVSGEYFGDILRFKDFPAQLYGTVLGYATEAAGSVYTGILGLGMASLEQTAIENNITYPTVLQKLYDEGAIASKAFSLVLNRFREDAGHIIMGGYDASRVGGNLTVVPVVADRKTGTKNRYMVEFTGFSASTWDRGMNVHRMFDARSLPTEAVVDSGTLLTRLPQDIFDTLASYVTARKEESGTYSVPCGVESATGSINFEIAGKGNMQSGLVLQVPWQDAVIRVGVTGENRCLFGFMPATDNRVILGDTFLKSVYTVFDEDNMVVGMAPAISTNTSKKPELVPFGANGVRGVSGAIFLDGTTAN